MVIFKRHGDEKMDKKFGIVLVLLTALILTMATIVSASRTFTEKTTMLNMEEVQSTHITHWTGDDAKSLAKYIDTNYYSKYSAPCKPDGWCQEEDLRRYVKEVYEDPEKEKGECENTFIDGIRGQIIDVDCDYGRWPGYGAIEEDITITCTYTTEWTLEEKNEHVYSRVGLTDNDAVSFTVPEGWVISSVEDLKGSSISSDNRTVSGLAISDKAHVIRFTKAPVPTPSPSPFPTPTPFPSLTPIPIPTTTPIVTPSPSLMSTLTPTPLASGFEAIFAIGGLLAVAYLVLRRKR